MPKTIFWKFAFVFCGLISWFTHFFAWENFIHNIFFYWPPFLFLTFTIIISIYARIIVPLYKFLFYVLFEVLIYAGVYYGVLLTSNWYFIFGPLFCSLGAILFFLMFSSIIFKIRINYWKVGFLGFISFILADAGLLPYDLSENFESIVPDYFGILSLSSTFLLWQSLIGIEFVNATNRLLKTEAFQNDPNNSIIK